MMPLTTQHLAAGQPRSHTLDLYYTLDLYCPLRITIMANTTGTAARTIISRQHGIGDGALRGGWAASRPQARQLTASSALRQRSACRSASDSSRP